MFSTAFDKLSGFFDRRFILNAFLPSLIFWGLLIAAILAGQHHLAADAKAWDAQDANFKAMETVGFLAWITFFAALLSSQSSTLLRWHEGYWNLPVPKTWETAGCDWHKAKLQEANGLIDKKMALLTEAPANADAVLQRTLERELEKLYEALSMNYPPRTRPEEVMPTRLGNILKSSELYPRMRYGLDPVLIWPRLYNLFPDHFVQAIADARSSLDFMIVISSLGSAFAVLCGACLLVVCAPWWLFLLCFWGGLLVATVAYQGALGSAILYAQQVRAGFDLYRNEFFKEMRLSLPATPAEEKAQWREVGLFILRNVRENPDTWRYTDTSSGSITGAAAS